MWSRKTDVIGSCDLYYRAATISVQYSTVDYKRSEFSQVQIRDGTVEFIKSPDGYIVRNTQNEYLNDVRETLLGKIEKVVETPLTKTVVSLFDVPSPKCSGSRLKSVGLAFDAVLSSQ